ncbi:MAG TPA: hypothetical protein VFM93_03405 [Candidatus Limnocylindria bacterium]|nr:hypothetical protein [Candidatus Limnocylindria bacterium]
MCDACGKVLGLDDGAVTWTTDGTRERGHAVVHAACAPATATDRVGLRLVTAPAGFLEFVTDRFARQIEDPAALASIVWALASFFTRPDTGVEMNVLRAATFGTTFGTKPGEIKRERALGRVLRGSD